MTDLDRLAKLREPFPPEMVEKLPKPMWKGAWDNQKGSNCPVCHGYHVTSNTIHLDYAGHANVTNRLLEVDPMWNWEPLAWTEQGTPLFSDKGMWIKLTVCGMTRLGYGDGNSVKEIIGDAIRNAAMRFGVALDLWSKIDLHAERNPGDGTTPRQQANTNRAPARGNTPTHTPRATPARAANQDALDALAGVCKEHGYSEEYCIKRFAHENDGADITRADADLILALADDLIGEATAEPVDEPVDAGTGAEGGDGADPAGVPEQVGEQPATEEIF